MSTKSVAAKSSITTKTSVLEQKRKLGISGIEEEEDKWEQFFVCRLRQRELLTNGASMYLKRFSRITKTVSRLQRPSDDSYTGSGSR